MAYDIGPVEGRGGGAARLIALAGYLENVPPGDYDHRAWRRRRDDGSWAMCALGHGVTALPDLIGLRWRAEDSDEVVRVDGSGVTQDVMLLAAEAFELTVDEARMLFGVGLHTRRAYGAHVPMTLGPRDVAAAIRRMAAEKLAGSAVFGEVAA